MSATGREALSALGRHPRHVVLAALVVGALLARPPTPATLALAALAAAVVGLALARPGLGLAAGGALVIGSAGVDARLTALDGTELHPRPQTVVVRAHLLEPRRARRFGGWSVAARLSSEPGRGERVVLRAGDRVRAARAGVGDEVVVRGRVETLARWERFERVRGAHAAVVVDAVQATGRRRGGLAGALDRVREEAEEGVTRGLPPPQAALARGMVLGQDEALDESTRASFRTSGLAHVLAASGANVALLALLATTVLGLLGAGLRGRLAGALVLIAIYVPVAGGGPSIQRAGIMGAAALVAGLAGRPGSRAYALLLAAAGTLALNPRADADAGWQLSFAAVIAIALLAPRWREMLVRRRFARPIAEALALSAAATVGTAPLLALHFERLSLVSLPANVIATAAVALVVWFGTAAAVLSVLGGAAQALGVAALSDLAALAASAINAVAALPLGFVGFVAHASARVPGASVAVALGGPVAVAVAHGAMIAAVASRRARRVVAGAAAALAATAVWAHAHPPGPPRDLTVSFLDVGQGDATLIQHGRTAILVDTGPVDGGIAADLRAAGVRRLDLLVLTHAQADHEAAAPQVLEAVAVDAVLDGGDGVLSPERAVIAADLRRRRIRRMTPDAGQRLTVGPLTVDVLWPPREPAERHAGVDPNDRATVLLVREGELEVLLPADAESGVLNALELPQADVLKVSHHGSADPGLAQVLEAVRPRVAGIEVGRHNRYGHPAPSTLRTLRAVPRVIRTDRDGTTRLTVSDGRLEVRTAR